MRTYQVIGWTAGGEKVTGSTAAQCRERGAVGILLSEEEFYEPGRGWVTVLTVVV